jgi:membrane fusion protein (multidrug efflux system)
MTLYMRLKYLLQYAGYAALVFLTACGSSKEQAPPAAPPPAKVTVQPVIKMDAVYYDEYPATINALNQVELRPQVSGFISGVYFKDGARVHKGQLLYSIDQQLYAANYQQAVAGLSVQEANWTKMMLLPSNL